MFVLTTLGRNTLGMLKLVTRLAAFAAAVGRLALDPRTWSVAVRSVLGKQVYFSGVQALGLVIPTAVLCGAVVVAQVHAWLATVGQLQLLGGVLVNLVVREGGPLLVGFVLVGRSGTAICAELAGMRSRREIDVLEAQGIDPLVYLVTPRAAALSISAFALSVVFAAVSILTGWLSGVLGGLSEMQLAEFMQAVFQALGPVDIIAFCVKSLLGGLLVGVVCSTEGLSTSGLSTEIPQAVTRGVVKSMASLLVMSAVISMLTSGSVEK